MQPSRQANSASSYLTSHLAADRHGGSVQVHYHHSTGGAHRKLSFRPFCPATPLIQAQPSHRSLVHVGFFYPHFQPFGTPAIKIKATGMAERRRCLIHQIAVAFIRPALLHGVSL